MENRAKTILIVDDDQDFSQSVEDLLSSEGYQVLRASNGKDGLALALKARPALLMLDVMMASDTEGIELSREIRQQPELKGMPVIIVTGITSEKHLPFRFEPDETWLPVAAVLEKPVAPQQLLNEIKRRLG